MTVPAAGPDQAGVLLPQALAEEIRERARAAYPEEVCGILVGTSEGEEVCVERVAPARNLNRERARDRYQLDPADFLAADRAARHDGLEIVGFWHSHPDHPARPSETDLEAAWEDYCYLIVSVDHRGAREMRSWKLSEKEFREQKILEVRS